jgi:hypothetical protein
MRWKIHTKFLLENLKERPFGRYKDHITIIVGVLSLDDEVYVCRLRNNHHTNIILGIKCCTTLLTLVIESVRVLLEVTLELILEVEVTLCYESWIVLSISLVAAVESLLSCCIRICVLLKLPSCLCSSRSRTYFTTDAQSVSMSWYRASSWDLRPDITSCPNVAVWNLRSCFCGVPSLKRRRICNLQCNHSMVRVAQNP